MQVMTMVAVTGLFLTAVIGMEFCYVLKKCGNERILQRKKNYIPEMESLSELDRKYAQTVILDIMQGKSGWKDYPRRERRQLSAGLFELLYEMPEDPGQTENSRIVQAHLNDFLEELKKNRIFLYNRILEMWECNLFAEWVNSAIWQSEVRDMEQKTGRTLQEWEEME